MRKLLIACALWLLGSFAAGAEERSFLMGLTPMNFDDSAAGTLQLPAPDRLDFAIVLPSLGPTSCSWPLLRR